MIKSYADNHTERLHETGKAKHLPQNVLKVALRKLDQLNVAKHVDDMRVPPGNKLHPLKDDRAGQWAVWINDQYRLCFAFENGDAYDVEIVDYHG